MTLASNNYKIFMQFTIILKNSNFLHNVTKVCLLFVTIQDGGRKSSIFYTCIKQGYWKHGYRISMLFTLDECCKKHGGQLPPTRSNCPYVLY